MRILNWNCNNGINRDEQISYFRSFKPDLAIIPELKERNIAKLAPSSHIWVTNNFTNSNPKGLGVLGFNGVQLELLPRDPDMEIFLPVKVRTSDLTLNLLAFWNFYSACKQGRFKGVEGPECLELSAVEYYRSLFLDPALMVGDLNYGPTFCKEDFLELAQRLESYGMKSLYHQFNSLDLGDSNHSTFRSTRKRLHHIDHIWGSEYFCKNMKSFAIDGFENVVLSDHAPLILDI